MSTDKKSAKKPRTPTRVRRKIKQQYFRVMPDNPHHRSAIWSVFWIVSAIILVQLMYPTTRALPLAYFDGEARGWQTETQLAADVTTAFKQTKLRLEAGEAGLEVPLAMFGAEPETATTVSQLTDYPFWQRYVPLSLLIPRQVAAAPITYTNSVAAKACNSYAEQLSRPAENAKLELKNGQLIATPEVIGSRVDPGQLCRDIQQQSIRLGSLQTIAVKPDKVTPAKTVADFEDVKSRAQAALDGQIVFSYQGSEHRPSREIIASWLKLGEDKRGATTIVAQDAKVKKYLAELNKSIGSPAGQTDIQIVNGVEVSRKEGKKGQVIDYSPAITTARQQLLGETERLPIELTLREIAPQIVYNSRYTSSQAGLQAYVNDATRQYNAHISIQQLSGPGWRAGARQHESIPSASTYKLYVAMRLFEDMAAGKIGWNDPILDTNVSTCFDRMTIASTNPCAEEWLRRFGREAVNQYLYSKGFSRGTTFTHPLATHTTAADLTNFMVRLDRGELFADQYKQRLLNSLGSHPYPFGIPTGSAGRVHDKVGFLWDYVHDTAIVDHPRGRYVMTIMTKGQSYARIASITREVEKIMYP